MRTGTSVGYENFSGSSYDWPARHMRAACKVVSHESKCLVHGILAWASSRGIVGALWVLLRLYCLVEWRKRVVRNPT